MIQTIVINLIGGPGCGKSTAAAELYAQLKKIGMSCHYIPENKDELNYIANFGYDYNELMKYAGTVDVIIKEGSLLDHIVYNTQEHNQLFNSLVIQEYNRFRNLDFYINRDEFVATKEFSEAECKHYDDLIKQTYAYVGVGYIEINIKTAVVEILNHIKSIGQS